MRSVLLVKAEKKPTSVIVNGKVHKYSWDKKEGLIIIRPAGTADVKIVIIP